ncbi:WcbI family polysaccharide biosynthesis putative acetyltransferase [Synechococcus sp. CCY 9618]|uniref:WcbI family polysaccharide biosynthesis putative acetyltransferase n=1 Tax=Synechococcus sp. CCY 9618 TaxID=2815602 RepID=UPI001C210696|nr:WcbI family polysaccharide biosynthesis putative acetyltransferase [Synechococcus sp. CCY 9618]
MKKLMLAGNCQVAALQQWLAKALPNVELVTLSAYHLIRDEGEISSWLSHADTSDLALMIPVKSGYRGFSNLGLEEFQRVLGARLICYPNLHSEIFFPFFGYAKTREGRTITNSEFGGDQYGDYHDFLAMALFSSSLKPWKLNRIRLRLAALNTALIGKLASNALRESDSRMKAISPYFDIMKTTIDAHFGFSFNHPNSTLLNELYKSIWCKVFRFSETSFMPLDFEPFGDSVPLPVPDFIAHRVRSIRGILATQPSSIARDFMSLPNYEERLFRSLRYYQNNEWVVSSNTRHPKFLRAKQFIRLGWGLDQAQAG